MKMHLLKRVMSPYKITSAKFLSHYKTCAVVYAGTLNIRLLTEFVVMIRLLQFWRQFNIKQIFRMWMCVGLLLTWIRQRKAQVRKKCY